MMWMKNSYMLTFMEAVFLNQNIQNVKPLLPQKSRSFKTLNTPNNAAYYNPAELAELLNFSLRTITRWTQDRRLPGQMKCGHAWRYEKIAIDRARRLGTLLMPSLSKAG